MKSLILGLRFSNGSELMTEFHPTNVENAISDFVDLIETQNKVLSSPSMSKALVRKSDVRPNRKAEFVAIFNGETVKTRLKLVVKPSKFENAEIIGEFFRLYASRSLKVLSNRTELPVLNSESIAVND